VIGGLLEIKEYLRRHFVTKDTGIPKYFLGIEIAHQKLGLHVVCSGSSRRDRIFGVQACWHFNGS